MLQLLPGRFLAFCYGERDAFARIRRTMDTNHCEGMCVDRHISDSTFVHVIVISEGDLIDIVYDALWI